MPRKDTKIMPHTPQPSTLKIVLSLTPELKEALIQKATEIFGNRKGSVSAYVEMVLRRELNMKIQGVEES